MRYRLMATYQGQPYEAGIGPSEGDVVLFAACPPPEELGFEPATGHWRKQLRIADVQALWESRPMGTFRGARCIILDDLGDRLHIAYLGHDAYQAEQLGYWQVDRGVFELITPRDEVMDVIEERTDYPHRSSAADSPAAPPLAPAPAPAPAVGVALPSYEEAPLPLEAAALRATSAAARRPPAQAAPVTTTPVTAAAAMTTPAMTAPAPAAPLQAAPLQAAPLQAAPLQAAPAQAAPLQAAPLQAAPLQAAPLQAAPAQAAPAPSVAEPSPHRRRRSERPRLATQRIFSELASLAAIPPACYAVGTEVDGAMCLLRTEAGFEVFNAVAGARHEVRIFDDEESAYFYLFGVLAAEAVRTGGLVPHR
jgi:hypothetical protein